MEVEIYKKAKKIDKEISPVEDLILTYGEKEC